MTRKWNPNQNYQGVLPTGIASPTHGVDTAIPSAALAATFAQLAPPETNRCSRDRERSGRRHEASRDQLARPSV